MHFRFRQGHPQGPQVERPIFRQSHGAADVRIGFGKA